MEPFVYITNIQSFSASHRLHNENLSAEENERIFGKCNHINSHGHNYKVEATVAGHINPLTGCVMNLSDLKRLLLVILDEMDHKRIDLDVDYFKNSKHITTAEEIAVYIWDQLAEKLPEGANLYEIKLHETEKNVVFYRGPRLN